MATLRWDDEKVVAALQLGLARGVNTAANNVVREAKEHLSGEVLNVRTGRLRRSVKSVLDLSDKSNPVARVGTNVFYGRLHEQGVGKLPMRPWLVPAAQDMLTKNRQAIKRAVQKALRGAS